MRVCVCPALTSFSFSVYSHFMLSVPGIGSRNTATRIKQLNKAIVVKSRHVCGPKLVYRFAPELEIMSASPHIRFFGNVTHTCQCQFKTQYDLLEPATLLICHSFSLLKFGNRNVLNVLN